VKTLRRILIPALFILLQASTAFAQAKEGTSMVPILTDALKYLTEIEEKSFEIVRMEFDIITDTKTTYRTLQAGWNYGIMAFGDYRVSDLDIAVYRDVDGTWVLVKNDDGAERYATALITPKYAGMYKIDIKVYKFAEGFTAAHYGLMVIHE
jgi:hypothetical protein